MVKRKPGRPRKLGLPVATLTLLGQQRQRSLRISYIAQRLEITSRVVARWIKKKDLRALNIGSSRRPDYRIFRDDLQEFLGERGMSQVRFDQVFPVFQAR